VHRTVPLNQKLSSKNCHHGATVTGVTALAVAARHDPHAELVLIRLREKTDMKRSQTWIIAGFFFARGWGESACALA
jgi:hypothetical protein